MIRNIIFDLGNVLISFKPAEYLEKKGYTDEIRKRILSDIFGSPQWLELDNGDISTSEAIDRISENSSLKRQEIALIFDRRLEIFSPITSNIKILPELKKQGFKLYFLSNFPGDIFDDVKNSNPFFNHFDGGLISAHVKLSKPDIRIFKTLLEKYGLEAGECFYIDDIEANVNAALSAGIPGFTTLGLQDISLKLSELLNTTLNRDPD